jgi:phosphatidylglycerol:prolipoprotein diacylglycerol transferase
MLGMIVAIILGIKEGKKLGISSEDILDGALIIVPLSILGARIWYVIFEWHIYNGNIFDMLDIRDGGLAIHGAFITAVVATYLYTKKKGINFISTLDIVSPGFMIAQAFGRWGNFFNQEAHGGVIGGVTSGVANLSLDEQRAFLSQTLHLPNFITNQMYLNGPDGLYYYHPTFLYESTWNIIGFTIILFLRRMKFTRRGDMFAFYLIWYSVGRFFIEGMRTDSLYIGNTGLRTAQIISILMILGGVVFLAFTHKIWEQKHYYKVIEENEEQLEELKKQNTEQKA